MKDFPTLFGMFDSHIESFRLKYNDICDKVENFSTTHGIILSTSLCALIMGLITCGYNFFAPVIIPAKYLWPTSIFVTMGMVASFVGPVYLLNQAKKPLEILSNVGMENASERTMIQVHMFMNSVQNFGGVSVMGFMNMDKPGALGILGVIVTYVLVVVQYQPI